MKSIIRVSAAMRTEVCILCYELQNKHSQKRNRIQKSVKMKITRTTERQHKKNAYVILLKKAITK